jgi:hypothetical protein
LTATTRSNFSSGGELDSSGEKVLRHADGVLDSDAVKRFRVHTQADHLRAVLLDSRAGAALLAGLSETCQIILTAIEAIDPVSATLVEELRLEVDKRLKDSPGLGSDD